MEAGEIGTEYSKYPSMVYSGSERSMGTSYPNLTFDFINTNLPMVFMGCFGCHVYSKCIAAQVTHVVKRKKERKGKNKFQFNGTRHVKSTISL